MTWRGPARLARTTAGLALENPARHHRHCSGRFDRARRLDLQLQLRRQPFVVVVQERHIRPAAAATPRLRARAAPTLPPVHSTRSMRSPILATAGGTTGRSQTTMISVRTPCWARAERTASSRHSRPTVGMTTDTTTGRANSAPAAARPAGSGGLSVVMAMAPTLSVPIESWRCASSASGDRGSVPRGGTPGRCGRAAGRRGSGKPSGVRGARCVGPLPVRCGSRLL